MNKPASRSRQKRRVGWTLNLTSEEFDAVVKAAALSGSDSIADFILSTVIERSRFVLEALGLQGPAPKRNAANRGAPEPPAINPLDSRSKRQFTEKNAQVDRIIAELTSLINDPPQEPPFGAPPALADDFRRQRQLRHDRIEELIQQRDEVLETMRSILFGPA